jgi:hypothetical protein
MISAHLYSTTMFSMTWVSLSKEKRKEPKHLKPIYLSNYLNQMKKNIKN